MTRTRYASTDSSEDIAVVVMDGEGRRRRVLYDLAFGPAWSPDGTVIVFSNYGGLGYGSQLYAVNLVDGKSYEVTHQGGRWSDAEPAWSPDGSRICFTRSTPYGHNLGILVIGVAPGARPRRAPEPPAHSCDWAPDGRMVAFAGKRGIEFAAADGTGRTLLRGTRPHDDDPTWSPDGSRIAFIRGASVNGTGGLVTVARDGTGLRRVAARAAAPDWQPLP